MYTAGMRGNTSYLKLKEIKVTFALHLGKRRKLQSLTNKPVTDTNMPLNGRTVMTSLQASASTISAHSIVFVN